MTHAGSGPPRETSQTLDRGLQILEILAQADGGRTISELATALGVARPVVYRLISALEGRRLVRRRPAGRITLGFGVLALAGGVQPGLREAALPVLRGLAEDVGATAHLTIAEGMEALAVAVVEPSWTDLHVAYRVGARHPLHRGAAGRAILAARPDATAPGAIPPSADATLPFVGGAAFVASAGELQPGAYGVAAALRGVPAIEGSVGVVALSPLDVALVGPRVARAAADVAAALMG